MNPVRQRNRRSRYPAPQAEIVEQLDLEQSTAELERIG